MFWFEVDKACRELVRSSKEGRENFGVSLVHRLFMVLISTISEPLVADLHLVRARALGSKRGGDSKSKPSSVSFWTSVINDLSFENGWGGARLDAHFQLEGV